MKNYIIIFFILSGLAGFSQKQVDVFFIANDSLRSQDYIISRLIIASKAEFNYPSNIEIFTDSANSNFGFIEVQYYHSDNNKFVNFPIRRHIDKVVEDKYSIKASFKLNTEIDFVSQAVFKVGLYRARVKIFFSKYNRKMSDVSSNWSFFYIQ
jgi:hypothetical protein